MSNWRENERLPTDFLEILYDQGGGGDNEDDVIAVEQDPDSERSRSPIVSNSAFQSALVYDDDDGELSADPDALHAPPETKKRRYNDSSSSPTQRSGRGSARGARGRGARGRGGSARGRGGYGRGALGPPITQVWTNDEEVHSLLTGSIEGEEYDDGVDSVLGLERDQVQFAWSPLYNKFQGQEETFKPEITGSIYSYNTAYDAFRSIWDDSILDLIATEANQYASTIQSPFFQSEWTPTNADEVLCLFAFWIMLGIIKMPTITSCFSVDPLLKTEVFRRIFTRRRYDLLTRALHFIDRDPAMTNPDPSISSAARTDRMFHLRPIITYLNFRFQSNYILDKNICIDEGLTLWKGTSDYKQYLRGKAPKCKTFELCESATGYLWSLIVYSDEQSADLESSPGVLSRPAVVKKLMGPLLNQGYRLFIDESYNSPQLARFLKLNGTDCVGTMRPSRREVPIAISKAPLKKGEYIARHSGDVSLLSWQDDTRVTMISTCHGASTGLPTVPTRPMSRLVPFQPQSYLDYTKFTGGVRLKDQMLEPYLLEKTRIANSLMSLFKRLLNISVLNSHTLLQSFTNKHEDQLAFRLGLVDAILTNHLSRCPQSRKYNVSSSRSVHQQPSTFVDSTHWPVLLEPTESTAARNRNFWKRCFVCLRQGRKNQRTPYCCESCRVPLCIKNCFKAYHTGGLNVTEGQ